MPSTEATDQPMKMKVIARPRCCGRRHHADRGGRLRREHRGAEHGQRRASAAAPRSSASARTARGRRRTRASAAASRLAPVEAADPAGEQRRAEAHHRGGDRDQLAADARPRPAATARGRSACRRTTITPQPITKLPNSSAQRTGARGAAGAARPPRGRQPIGIMAHLQRIGIDDVRRAAVDEVDDVVEGGA